MTGVSSLAEIQISEPQESQLSRAWVLRVVSMCPVSSEYLDKSCNNSPPASVSLLRLWGQRPQGGSQHDRHGHRGLHGRSFREDSEGELIAFIVLPTVKMNSNEHATSTRDLSVYVR